MFYCENLIINKRKFPEKIFFRTFPKKRKFSGNLSAFTSFSVGVWYHTAIVCFVVVMWCFTVEVEWCSAGNVGGSADTDVHKAVREWRWRWWRPPSIQAWQVHECWAPSVHHTGISVLSLVSDPDWLAAVANQSVAPASAEEAYWAWVYVKLLPYLQSFSITGLTALWSILLHCSLYSLLSCLMLIVSVLWCSTSHCWSSSMTLSR